MSSPEENNWRMGRMRSDPAVAVGIVSGDNYFYIMKTGDIVWASGKGEMMTMQMCMVKDVVEAI